MSWRCHDGGNWVCRRYLFMLRRGILIPLPNLWGKKGGNESLVLVCTHDMILFFGGPRAADRGRTPRLLEQPLGLHGNSKGSGWHTLNRSRRWNEEDGTNEAGRYACLARGRERRSYGRGKREISQTKTRSVIPLSSPPSSSPLAHQLSLSNSVIQSLGRPTHSNFLATLTFFFFKSSDTILFLIERDRQPAWLGQTSSMRSK